MKAAKICNREVKYCDSSAYTISRCIKMEASEGEAAVKEVADGYTLFVVTGTRV